jgi:hypothetical protein
MNKYCLDLKFDIPPLNPGTDLSYYMTSHHSNINESHLNKEFLDFFHTIKEDCVIGAFEVFYMKPNDTMQINVDQINVTEVALGDFTKINWVYYGEGSTMNWYKPKDIESVRNKKVEAGSIKTTDSTPNFYLSFNYDEVDLAHAQQVNFPSLVQVGVPHSVRTSNEHRVCVSLTFGSLKEYRRYTWDESVSILKNFIV